MEAEFKDFLNRTKFIDLLIRIAKLKFVDSNQVQAVYQSLELLIQQHIVPNLIEKMETQYFRDKHVYTLEIDDVLKLNKPSVEKLYRTFATGGPLKVKSLTF